MPFLPPCLQYYLGDDFPRPVIGGELAASQLSGTKSGSNISLFATLSLPNDQVRPCLLQHASMLLAEGNIAEGHIAEGHMAEGLAAVRGKESLVDGATSLCLPPCHYLMTWYIIDVFVSPLLLVLTLTADAKGFTWRCA